MTTTLQTPVAGLDFAPANALPDKVSMSEHPTPNTEHPNEFRLGPLAAIPPGEGRQFQVEGRDIAVFHARNGSVYATQAFCPHQAGPLADGLLGGSIIVCPFHAWKFDLATGQPLLGTCSIQTYSVRLAEDGVIVLSL